MTEQDLIDQGAIYDSFDILDIIDACIDVSPNEDKRGLYKAIQLIESRLSRDFGVPIERTITRKLDS